MKRSLILASLLMLVPVLATAQIPMMPGLIEFSASGGASVPFGDFNTVADPGYGLGGTAAFYAMPNLAVGGSFAYNSYSMDEALPGPDLNMSIWEMTAYGKYLLMPGPVSPYAKVGAGLFRTSVEGSSALNDMGLGGGVGAQLRLPASNIGFFAEGMAYSVFTEGSSTNYYTIRGGIHLYVSPKP